MLLEPKVQEFDQAPEKQEKLALIRSLDSKFLQSIKAVINKQMLYYKSRAKVKEGYDKILVFRGIFTDKGTHTKLVQNRGKITPEEAIEALDEFVNGLRSGLNKLIGTESIKKPKAEAALSSSIEGIQKLQKERRTGDPVQKFLDAAKRLDESPPSTSSS